MKKIIENDGIELFTRFADKYCNKIEDSHTAEDFFKEFLTASRGCVNIDCLDADNDDRIESVYFDLRRMRIMVSMTLNQSTCIAFVR